MNDIESLKKEYRTLFPDLPDKKIEEWAKFMNKKYSTIKHGSNVIHLDYYHGLLDDLDIMYIENNISKVGLELSRFDKNGVPYASIEDYTLQVALYLSDPIISNIILGVSAGALWDAIKTIAFYIWKTIKEKYWKHQKDKKSKPINFGFHIKLKGNISLDLKVDGELDEKTVLKTLDKVIVLLKDMKPNDKPTPTKFFTTDINGEWKEINIREEIMKERLKQQNSKIKGLDK